MEYLIWIVVSILVGGAYTYLLYSAKSPWGKYLNYGIALARFLVVAAITYLIFSPFLSHLITTIEKPVIVFAIDNSASLTKINRIQDITKSLKKQADILRNQDLDIKYEFIDNTAKDLSKPIAFSAPRTDLAKLLSEIKNKYEGRNLESVVLVSDGIYNAGYSPLYEYYNFKIHTIGLGDTIPRRDLILTNVAYNKIATLDSRTPVVAEVTNIGFRSMPITVNILEGKKLIAHKIITPTSDNGFSKLEFLVDVAQKGLHHYIVQIEAQKGEYTTANNTTHIYIDVLDARQKILLVAGGIHPDIKALASAIDKNQNLELNIHIPGINAFKDLKYDLVIFHQVPNIYNLGNDLLEKVLKQNTPVWFILGNQSDLNRFNTLGLQFSIAASGNQQDKVTPELNGNFSKFIIDETLRSKFAEFSPLTVPFGVYDAPSWDVILYQKVGMTTINKPLLAIKTNGDRKRGVLAGEGIWQWRMSEYAATDQTVLFDDFFIKTIQLLAEKEDKNRFRCNPTTAEFDINEKVFFNTETYNEIFEKIYGNEINLKLKDEDNKKYDYSFINTQDNGNLEIAGLPQGIYKYNATTTLSGKTEFVSGEFSISQIDLENMSTQANLELMRQIAAKNNGQFFTSNTIENLSKYILENKPKGIVNSSENISELINWQWLFFLLIILLALEWGLRKYHGGY